MFDKKKYILLQSFGGIPQAVWVSSRQKKFGEWLDGIRDDALAEDKSVYDTDTATPDSEGVDFEERDEWRLFEVEEGTDRDTSVILRSLFIGS